MSQSEFDLTRSQLRDARAGLESVTREIAAQRERLRQVAADEAELARVFDADDEAHIARRNALATRKKEAGRRLGEALDAKSAASSLEAGLLQELAPFTDPIKGIGKLEDSTPILLMPVRLETRFRDIGPGTGAVPARELLVRVYPDDCWIDSFDPRLTKTEVENAKAYWASIWQAGGIEDLERGAWRSLVDSHGSGRASWILEQFQPLNLAAKPAKPRREDVILTIPTEIELTLGEASATLTFWKAYWLADGDAVQADLAVQAFENAVGAQRAAEIAEEYEPFNFTFPIASGLKKQDLNVSAAFVVFPPADPKQSAWAHPPRINLLPDRFVFIGYRGSVPPVVVVGEPVPSSLQVGIDPSAPEDEQAKNDAGGNLLLPEEIRWVSDFDLAVKLGMGFRIRLSTEQSRGGFDRVLVVGLRLSADKTEAQQELQGLLKNHGFSRKGLSLVPQGTPTNNTEAAGSGYGRIDDPDQSFDRATPQFISEAGWMDKRDGQWVAEYLGVDPKLFEHAPNAGGEDQLTERAMNTALWPATLGYWMETMMAPVFSPEVIDQTRSFFSRYVLASGAIPAIRIGAQPYGILPATMISRMDWLKQRGGRRVLGGELQSEPEFLNGLYRLLLEMDRDWETMAEAVSFTGKTGDPHKILLDIVGLHPGSVEWSKRYAESLKTLYNRLNLQGFGGWIQSIILEMRREQSRDLLTRLGYQNEATPPLLEKVFSGKHLTLKDVVDDKPLSESDLIRAYAEPGHRNYIQWLIDAAGTSLSALYEQDGFVDDQPPSALLYLLLRHALQLGYHDVGIRLHESAGLFTAEMARSAKLEDPFIHIKDNKLASESRYQTLYALEPAITGTESVTVGNYIGNYLAVLGEGYRLREQIDALERLKRQPTARLERAFADHIDTCAYRLDSWILGLINYQLGLMRNLREGAGPARRGVYLGGYAWLERLRPENKVLEPVTLEEDDLVAIFQGSDEPALTTDTTNQGYIHAPSLNHAVAAAVLRNGYISNASPLNRKTMAVNLTSERVRTALALIEGIRAGQGLADLLGYQFERGLHDRHALAEVDKFIFELRMAFPLRLNRINSTKTEEAVSQEAIKARNVIDGLALVEHIKKTNNKTYPFGKTGLPDAEWDEAKAINAEAERLIESQDAVADLALSEGVYQAVLGNYDRVASTYDAFARGNFPPEPDVVRTPFEGIGLTHRVALHLDAGADPTVSPVAAPVTPRAFAEPALNSWLAGRLPPLADVGCVVEFRDAPTGATTIGDVNLEQLGLQPADLLVLVRDNDRQAMSELDDRILRFAFATMDPRPDVPVTIRYMAKGGASFSVFELMPLLRYLRSLVTRSRPLKSTDLTLMNESSRARESEQFIDPARLVPLHGTLETLRDDLAVFQAQLEGPLSDLANRRGEILANVDNYVDQSVELLARAALFAIPQAGWGFVYDFKRRTFVQLLEQATQLVARWNQRLSEFDDLITQFDNLPPAATVEEKFTLLTQAETLISTALTNPLPADPNVFRTDLVTLKKAAFIAETGLFDNLKDTTHTQLPALMANIEALLPVTAFDNTEYSLSAAGDEIVRFVEDLVALLKVLIGAINRRLVVSQERFDDHAASANASDRVKALEEAARALLGDDFKVIPSFVLKPPVADEIENALAASRSGELFKYLTQPPDPATPPLDFPVDTWLYGVARVREKIGDWEQMVMMTSSLGKPAPELDAIQLPFATGDRWLGLEFPPELDLEKDRLLYTAHFANFPFNKAAPMCGLLLDEWTEVIPGTTADTGITFHHDRPNSEAPQTMLLVTPTQFRGAWQWEDLVGALNETLDLAKRRAVEPVQVDNSPYAPFLPATIMAHQVAQLTIAANLELNVKVALQKSDG